MRDGLCRVVWGLVGLWAEGRVTPGGVGVSGTVG